jgi:hypothetical protein
MSVTATQALAAVRTQIEAGSITFPLYWQGEDAPLLPNDPTTFGFVVFTNEGARHVTAFGGGRGANLYRNRAIIEAYVFAPNGEGLGVATDAAELIAAQLRSFRNTSISCYAADVIPVGPGSSISPPGFTSEVSNYQCAVAEIALTFDTIG